MEKDTAQYVATMESAYRSKENALFYGLDSTSYARASVPGYPDDVTVSNPNDSVVRVNGNGPKVGPSIILKVMAGDVVDLGVQYYYNDMTNSNGPGLQASDLLNSLATGLGTLSSAARESITALNSPTGSPLLGALTSSIGNQNGSGTSKPQAYLNWMLLDNQFHYVSGNNQSGALQVGPAGTQSNGALQAPLAYSGLPITKSGYLYIYVSNASPGWDVFFDNLSVKHYSGPLTEEEHYYPFGLTMAGISDKAVKTGYAENKYRFNKGSELQNKEFSDGSGLEMYETQLRELDPQLGRWWQIDPVFTNGVDGDDEVNDVLIDGLKSQSPYASMDNNPIRLDDPNGDCVPCAVAIAEGIEALYGAGAVGTASSVESSGNGSTMGPGEAIVAALNPVGAWHGMVKAWNMIFSSAPAPQAPAAPPTTHTPSAPSAPSTTGASSSTNQATSARRKNWIPDKGAPNSTQTNPSGTTTKKYGPDGNVQKEYNDGHGSNAPANEQDGHVHDYKPNPLNPTGRGTRMPGRVPKKGELLRDFNRQPPPPPPPPPPSGSGT